MRPVKKKLEYNYITKGKVDYMHRAIGLLAYNDYQFSRLAYMDKFIF